MAFSVTGRASANDGTTSAQTITTGSFTPSANSLLLFGGGAQADDAVGGDTRVALGSISGGSLSWGSPIQSYAASEALGDSPEFDYFLSAAVYSAAVGGSPSSMTVAWDPFASTVAGWNSALVVEVTGHDSGAPITQSARNSFTHAPPVATNDSLTVTLGSTPAVGSLVMVFFAIADDAGTGIAAPTIGGQSMTQVYNQSGSIYTTGACFYRIITGAESNSVITCSDVGNQTTKGTAFAVEIAEASTATTGSGAPSLTRVTGAGSGTSTAPGGTGAPTLARHTAAGSGSTALPTVTGSGAVTLARHTASGFDVVGRFPVAVSSNGRYLEDQFGDPWLGVGDTAWSLVAQLSYSDMVVYLDDRATKGVNLVLCSVPEPYYTSNTPPSDNNAGDAPFTGTPFQSTLNAAYWDTVDDVVAYAESLGITLLICPFYIGASDGDGWGAEIVAASNAQMETYAGYLDARYGTAQNIIWMIGHDRDNASVPSTWATHLSRADAFVAEMRSLNSQLITFGGWHSFDVNGTDTFGWGRDSYSGLTADPDFDTQYDYSGHIAVNAYDLWDNTPAMPVMFLEGIYEQEQPGPLGIGDVLLREQMWASWCAGACATIFGNNPIWGLEASRLYTAYTGTWEDNLDYEGSTDLAAFASITSSLGDWWAETAADTTSTFVTTQGTGSNRVAARFSGSYGLIYHPAFTAGTITVDLTEFATLHANVKVTRYDPRSGATTTVGTYATSGTQNLSAPSANSAGDNDWLYVLEGQPTGTSATTLVRHTAAGAGTSTPPGASGSGSPSLVRHVGAGSGSTVPPGASGSSATTLVRRTATGSGTSAPPSTSGSGATALVRHVGAGSGSTALPTATGAASLVTARATASGSGTTTIPSVTGSGAVTLARHTANGSDSTGGSAQVGVDAILTSFVGVEEVSAVYVGEDRIL